MSQREELEDEGIVVQVEDQEGKPQEAEDNPATATTEDDDVPQPEVNGEAAEEEVVVTIDGEEPPEDEHGKAPPWVKEVRKQNREQAKVIRELQTQLSKSTEQKPATLGAKPKLEDFDYDAEKYEQELASWFDKKRAVEAEAEKARKAQEAQQQQWQNTLESYGKAKAALKARDFDDAEATAQEIFNATQQGVVLEGTDNPALVVYALGKNAKKAAELAKITNPVKFAVAIGKLEEKLKVQTKKTAPPPERVIKSSGPISGSIDSTLERLRAEAEKTGNYSKVTAYKAQIRQKK